MTSDQVGGPYLLGRLPAAYNRQKLSGLYSAMVSELKIEGFLRWREDNSKALIGK